MGFLSSLFTRKDSASPTGRESAADTADAVARARTRARQRLIGAVILLGIGIIGFPLLFETQPRPIPIDIPIEIPRKDGLPPLELPAPKRADASPPRTKATGPVLTESAADAGKEVPPRNAVEPSKTAEAIPAPVEAAPTPAPQPAPVAAKPPPTANDTVASKAPAPANDTAAGKAPAATAAAESARAKALLAGEPVVAAASDKGRFVVQVGAFADASAARDTRTKVEKLGLKTYTQIVDTDGGKRTRVRVGPFPSREDASKVADKIKAAGLPSVVLTL